MAVYITDAIHADGLIEKNQILVKAHLGKIEEVEVETPVYDGPTSVSVADSTVTLATNGKKLESNISIAQGIPLYTGASTFVVQDSNITIPTSGKRLNSDITVDISALETLASEIDEVIG